MFTVARYYQIMEQLGSKDLFRKLVVIHAIIFLKLYLILYASVQTFDVTGYKIFRWDLTASSFGVFVISQNGLLENKNKFVGKTFIYVFSVT